MLVWVLATAACPCPSVSITSRSSTETAGRIDLVFGTMTSFDLYSTLCFKEIRVSTK